MPDKSLLISYVVEFFAILAMFSMAFAIGYALYRSFRLVIGERELTKRLQFERRSRLAELLQSLPSDPKSYDEAERVLRSYIDRMPDDLRRKELLEALRQPTHKGRVSYASKILTAAEYEKSFVK